MSDFGNDGEDIRPIDTAAGARGKKEDDDKLVVRTEDADRNLVKKGDYVDLLRRTPSLRELYAGTGWQLGNYEGDKIDVDLCCFLLDRNGQTRVDEDFIFYNQPSTLEGAVKHLGDSRTGDGVGDDECIFVDLTGLPFDIVQIDFVLSIYDEAIKGWDFSMMKHVYIRIVDKEEDIELLRLRIDNPEEFKGETCLLLGSLVREGAKWFFDVKQQPVPGGLAKIATQYGIIVRELTV